jgi:hypothetical protein
MGLQQQAIGTGLRPSLDANHPQAVMILGRQKPVGFAKHIHGPGDIEGLDTRKNQHGNASTHGANSPQ